MSPFLPELQIISEEDFIQAAKAAESRKNAYAGWQSTPRNTSQLLIASGNLFCGTCGRRMSYSRPAVGAKRKAAQYLCCKAVANNGSCSGQRTYSADKVDAKVLEATAGILELLITDLSETVLKAALKRQRHRYRKDVKDAEQAFGLASAEVKLWLGEVGNSLLSRSQYTAEEIVAAYEAATEKEKNALQSLIEKQAAIKALKQKQIHIQQLFQQLPLWKAALAAGKDEESQTVIRNLYSKIEIERGYKITFHLDADVEEMISMDNEPCMMQLREKLWAMAFLQ